MGLTSASSRSARRAVDVVDFALLGLAFNAACRDPDLRQRWPRPRAGSAIAAALVFFFLGQAAGPALYNLGFNAMGASAAIALAGAVLILNASSPRIICGGRSRSSAPR